ncbi:hypothetical protein V1511DRAFT_469514 [Dipodascopsis uninucleata]
MSRDDAMKIALGSDYNAIQSARVLMVGAGGIGCELLKNLVLTGFGEIHLVDLDTIDLSNLNRQFLFGHEHIKQSKALVAKETASKFNSNVNLVAYHANIKDPQFTVQWFKSFDLVFNALDNLDARRYVNKMCLIADVPLVESGTTGFNGQAQLIVKGRTECYDCNPKPVVKSFPVCTIRTTPSQPIHCIVWAKSYLFNQLFGIGEDESPDLDNTKNAENADEIANLKREMSELKRVKDAFGSPEFVKVVFEKVFETDINRLLSMEDAWKYRRKPVTLSYDDLKTSVNRQNIDIRAVLSKDMVNWTIEENVLVFEDSVNRLSKRLQLLQKVTDKSESFPMLSFDKDDEDTLDFVAAAANLRSKVFGIDLKSKFEIKEMAGNIIPAIATTNAIIAGVCVLEAFKVLQKNFEKAKMVFLSRQPGRIFSTESLQPPVPTCAVCSIARCSIQVDVSKMTLGKFLDEILMTKLGYSAEISIVTSKLLYDIEFDDNLNRTLKGLGVGEGSFISVIDEDDSGDLTPRVNLEFLVYEKSFNSDDIFYSLESIPQIPRQPPKNDNIDDKQSDLEAPLVSSGSGTTHKRKAEELELGDGIKKARVDPSTAYMDIIDLDDDETIDID